jgi:hypothetical protein
MMEQLTSLENKFQFLEDELIKTQNACVELKQIQLQTINRVETIENQLHISNPTPLNKTPLNDFVLNENDFSSPNESVPVHNHFPILSHPSSLSRDQMIDQQERQISMLQNNFSDAKNDLKIMKDAMMQFLQTHSDTSQ